MFLSYEHTALPRAPLPPRPPSQNPRGGRAGVYRLKAARDLPLSKPLELLVVIEIQLTTPQEFCSPPCYMPVGEIPSFTDDTDALDIPQAQGIAAFVNLKP